MSSYFGRKVIADGVYILDRGFGSEETIQHACPDGLGSNEMTLRENEDGPLYWCTGCGYILEEGLSMAIRLNEVDI